nr:integrin alpha-X-like isoform X3 [Pogona vitticeps]
MQNGTVCRIENVFNQNVDFGSTDPKIYADITYQRIRVTLLKEHVFDYTPVVIGSSVGGFALLILMIFFLYKCGFFKRNYQHMREQDDSLKVDQDAGWNDRQSDESENLNGN